MKKIIINGNEYSSINEVPAAFRDLLKDQNKNGIPDIADKAIREGKQHSQVNKLSVNGKIYDNMASLTPQQKAQISEGLKNAQQYLNNPIVAGLVKGLTGIDTKELTGKLTNNAQQNPSRNIIESPPTSKVHSQSRPLNTPTPEAEKITENFSPQQKTSYLSSQRNLSIQPGVKKDTGRTFVAFAAIIGLIGWLLFTYTDII